MVCCSVEGEGEEADLAALADGVGSGGSSAAQAAASAAADAAAAAAKAAEPPIDPLSGTPGMHNTGPKGVISDYKRQQRIDAINVRLIETHSVSLYHCCKLTPIS